MVLNNCKSRLTNQCMAWINYKKVFVMGTYSWITESLDLVSNFIIGGSMKTE